VHYGVDEILKYDKYNSPAGGRGTSPPSVLPRTGHPSGEAWRGWGTPREGPAFFKDFTPFDISVCSPILFHRNLFFIKIRGGCSASERSELCRLMAARTSRDSSEGICSRRHFLLKRSANDRVVPNPAPSHNYYMFDVFYLQIGQVVEVNASDRCASRWEP